MLLDNGCIQILLQNIYPFTFLKHRFPIMSFFVSNSFLLHRLVEYPFDDVEFSPEGPMDAWCGVETRRCRLCVFPVDESSVADTWSWCGTRTMSMRLAIRLHRLSILTDGNGLYTFKKKSVDFTVKYLATSCQSISRCFTW